VIVPVALALPAPLAAQSTAAVVSPRFSAELLAREPDEALPVIGRRLERDGRPRDALIAYREMARRMPDESRAHQLVGWLALELGDAAPALDAFRRAATLAPDDARPHLGTGEALSVLGRHEDALRAFRAAVVREPALAEGWGRMATEAMKLGRTNEAVQYWNRALGADPSYFTERPAERSAWERQGGASPSRAAATPTSELSARPYVGTTSGSGFVVDADGHVLTNKHVVRGCASVRVRSDSMRPVVATVVATDPDDDLALLLAAQPLLAPARFRANAGPRPGDDVVAVGFPLVGLLADQMHVSVGTVNALAGLYNDLHNLQMSAPVQPGNSGGPLLDGSGNVVGVVVTKLDARAVAEQMGDLPQNVNFAIKAGVAREFLETQGVKVRTATSAVAKSNADVGEMGRAVTVLVECVRVRGGGGAR
jgi:S1-C subfamily serine protease